MTVKWLRAHRLSNRGAMRDEHGRSNGALAGAVHWGGCLGAAAVGLLALAIGAFVYMVDRPAGHAALLPGWGTATGTGRLGAIGDWLPSFLHPFGFALLTVAALRTRRAAVSHAICTAWTLVNVVIECAQWPAAAAAVSRFIDAAPVVAPALQPVRRYLLNGTFDPGDVMAALAGGLAAAVVLSVRHQGGNAREVV